MAPTLPAQSWDLARTYGPPRGLDPSLVAGVIAAESGGNPSAVSSAGAQGLMQLMPGTAAALGVADPLDAAQNVDGGTRLLAELLRQFGSLELALAAYNAGPAAVIAAGGVPQNGQTEHYVPRVLAYAREYADQGGPAAATAGPARSGAGLILVGLVVAVLILSEEV